MSTVNVEGVDLAQLVETVRARAGSALLGAVVGRTQIRDLLAEHLGCSLLQAEELVDTMVGRGLVRLEREGDGREVWRLPAAG
jgi:hypothetical protein